MLGEAVYLALLALTSAAVGKLWLDIGKLQESDTDCKVQRAIVAGELALLKSQVANMQQAAFSTKVTPEQALVIANEAGVITEWSPGAKDLFGWESEEAVGKTIVELLCPVDLRESHEKPFKLAVASARTIIVHKIPLTRILVRGGTAIGLLADINVQGWKLDAEHWKFAAIFDPRERTH